MWREFVELAEKREEPFAVLCERFGISRKTGYKWLNRFRTRGAAGLQPLSRRPKRSPRRTPETVVAAVLALRTAHPDWSIQRLHQALMEQGVQPLPGLSTVDLIVRRRRQEEVARQLALPPEAQRSEPGYRWIVEVRVPLTLAGGSIVHPVLVRDAATDFWLTAELLPVVDEAALAALLEPQLRRHGLPWRLVLPVGSEPHTAFTLQLMRWGVAVERAVAPSPAVADSEAGRQLAARLAALPVYQRAVLANPVVAPDDWSTWAQRATAGDRETAAAQLEALRTGHNFGGPQGVMQRQSPVARFRSSPRPVPAHPPTWEPAAGAEVRLVSEKGLITFRRRLVLIGRAFAGETVALQPAGQPGLLAVAYYGHTLGRLDLTSAASESAAVLLLVG